MFERRQDTIAETADIFCAGFIVGRRIHDRDARLEERPYRLAVIAIAKAVAYKAFRGPNSTIRTLALAEAQEGIS
jgi:hypothetical protein